MILFHGRGAPGVLCFDALHWLSVVLINFQEDPLINNQLDDMTVSAC